MKTRRAIKRVLLVTAISGPVALAVVLLPSNIDPVNKFSWSENLGHMNWRDANGGADGVLVATDHLSGYIWFENAGFMNVGNDNSPYGNTDGTDFGINVFPNGDLDGFAWAENRGWANFGWGAGSGNADRARYDSSAQRFRGWVWMENGGWVNLDDNNEYVGAALVNGIESPVPAPAPHDILKNRYISFNPANAGGLVKLQVTLTGSLPHPGLVGSSWWVQAPVPPGNPLLPAGECVALAGPQATAADIDWLASGCTVLHVTGCPIEPTSDYEVRAIAGISVSNPLTISTILKPGVKNWGDCVGFFNGTEWTPPNLTTNIDDAVAIIKTWQGGPVVAPMPGSNVAHLSVADMDPGDINLVTNFNDVFKVVQAFTGLVYPFGPADADGNCP